MKKILTIIAFGAFILALALAESQGQKSISKMSKWDYYNQILAPQRGLPPLVEKPTGFADRKRSVLNVGNLIVRISNAATLGYDRWGLNHEFPAGSGITYYWTLAPMVAGIKKINGVDTKLVASGTRGAFRLSEEEYQPLPGYDSGIIDPQGNIGIAFSDKPESWPAFWPRNPYVDAVTGQSFNIEKPLDKDHPEGQGLNFPGVWDGKVVATREAYFVVTDNDPEHGNSPAPLDIRIDLWALQYSDILNEDFIIFRFVVTNVGKDTLRKVHIGFHADPDTPEQGGAEWTDDFAKFIPEGDTSVDPLLWNFIYLWDGDDKAEGFIESNVAWVGLKVLETPFNRGITTLDVFAYSDVPQGDVAEYAQLASGRIDRPDNVTPHPDDGQQKSNTYGPDITIVISSGPFDLAPGESLPMTFADILGVNEADLFYNAQLAQILYNGGYKAAAPPPEPHVRAVAEDEKVTLYWDAEPSESGFDPLTGNNAFEGYRIYKSTDRGRTWGKPITDVNGVVRGYVPIAIFDVKNAFSGVDPLNPYLDHGSNSGLKHKFVDTKVINGFEYWYAVCAFDHRDGVIPPMENPRKNDASVPDDNTVAVVPRTSVAGYQPSTLAVNHPRGISTASVSYEILDSDAVITNTYRITIDDTSSSTKTFSVYDSFRNSVVIAGNPLLQGQDFIPTFDGIRLYIKDEPALAFDPKRSFWYSEVSQGPAETNYTIEVLPALRPRASDYEIRFTAKGDTSVGIPIRVPFEIWNVTYNTQLDFILQSAGTDTTPEMRNSWTSGDKMLLRESVKGKTVFTWSFVLTAPPPDTVITDTDTTVVDTSVAPKSGDIAKIFIKKPLTSEDIYELSTTAATTAGATAKALQGIKVVPNPYVVTSVYETSLEEKQILFTHLPKVATIRIFNMAGELVKTIEHTNGTSIEAWNLRTYNDQEIAFGIYFFHLTAPGIGETMGKFAVIK